MTPVEEDASECPCLPTLNGETVVLSSPFTSAGTCWRMVWIAAACPALAARWRGRLPKLFVVIGAWAYVVV